MIYLHRSLPMDSGSLSAATPHSVAIDTVRDREKEFFEFLDSELDKVETFYRQKEEQAGQRLAALREQLHEMRNRRNEELAELRQRKERGEDGSTHDAKGISSGANGWVEPIKSRIFKPGANSKAFSKPHFTPVMKPRAPDSRRDYIKRPASHEVSYRSAKRKLKLALQEFYRGLELLQSYAQLNRTAFRKLNKKYDKAVNARPPYRYMNEKVNKSWFVNSTTVDGYIHSVEDLYARYFEKGNHKIASGKLHRLNRRPGDESAVAFRNGLFIGTGAVFTLQGLVYGSQLLFDPDPEVQQQTSYLMQLYAAPILYHRSRQWLMYSHYRLFFAGLYPVEFRDFFLGDMYCSLTYATSNVELFFCLYAHHWNNPVQCNSNNSRLLGFFSALPPIWRALQCIRRYRDTKNVFPHLVNGGKYGMTIMAAVTLSLYRMRATDSNLGLFITFSTMNGIYTSIWDLFMDFSFFQPDTRHRFLRDILGLKRRWLYYGIMVLDPILRFSWIFYAIFTHDKQHSTLVSFFVALAEITRRGMWALFRVENEHCANVAQYKASRDVPLPYHLHPNEPLVERVDSVEEEQRRASTMPVMPVEGATASAVDLSMAGASAIGRDQSGALAHSEAQAQAQAIAEGGILRWRRKSEILRSRSIRGIMADAHKQDFEKRRRAPEPPTSDHDADLAEQPSEESEGEDDDDDDESTGSLIDERLAARRDEDLVKAEASGSGV
ncbi:hypothetical protein ABKA04_001880 [Annulohypoxylon sp. FPYF3050]